MRLVCTFAAPILNFYAAPAYEWLVVPEHATVHQYFVRSCRSMRCESEPEDGEDTNPSGKIAFWYASQLAGAAATDFSKTRTGRTHANALEQVDWKEATRPGDKLEPFASIRFLLCFRFHSPASTLPLLCFEFLV